MREGGNERASERERGRERASEEEVGFAHNGAWALVLADALWQRENFQSPKQKASSVSCQRQKDQAMVDLI